MKKLKPFLWLSALLVSGLTSAQPQLSAESALVMDAESGKVLYQKNADTSRFPASTTKIMTAMLLLENCTPDEIIVAPADITKVNQASMHLHPGEKITAGDMLYAILLRSANDGCVATAVHVSGSVPKFVELMNKRAKELGCTNTNFNNPNGLNDEKHTTTAHDLAVIARAAMRYPAFAQAVRTYKYTIKRDPKLTKDTLMVNHDKYLLKDPSADGIKTGWTIPAGRCFVGSATREGYRLLTVVLKSKDWQKDHAALLEWGYQEHFREPIFKAGQTLGPLKVQGGTVSEIALMPSFIPVHMWSRSVTKSLKVRFDHPGVVQAPVRRGQKVGLVTITDEDGFTQTADLLAAQDVAQTTTAKIIGTASSSPSFFLIGGCLGLGAVWMRAKARRRFYAKRPVRRVA